MNLRSMVAVGVLTIGAGLPAFAAREILFEANQGQADPGVGFLARTASYTLLLQKGDATLVFQEAGRGALAVRFRGANRDVAISGLNESPAKVNYFSGPESTWKRNINTYARVRYGDLYPGIDLSFYGIEGRIEYDFVVKPGAERATALVAAQRAQELLR